jgi:3-oxoacyl-[acyl-carrier-protein] synthase-3
MYITGIGYYVPERVMTNEELSTLVDTSDEWIRGRTGIEARRLAADDQNCSDLGAEAARRAMQASGTDPDEITHIIACTVSADAIFPATACIVQHKLGIRRAMSFDLSAACSGFLYGLQVARGLLAAEPEAKILLLGVEVISRRVNWRDRSTCVLFGDGAGVAVLSARPDGKGPRSLRARVEGVSCDGDGSRGDLLRCIGGASSHSYRQGEVVGSEYFLHMNGQEIYKHAVRTMSASGRDLLDRLGYTLDDIDLVVPHQANMRIIQAVLARLGVPEEKAFTNLEKYGNTSAATVPIALAEALDQSVIRPGCRVLMTTFGAGLTWGAGVIHFEHEGDAHE